MPPLVLSPLALNDMEEILAWTDEQFGPQSRRRYEALLIRALNDVARNPDLTGSHACPEVDAAYRIYHLRNSRDVRNKRENVKQPRHFVIYRTNPEGVVEVARILHDSMNLPRHIT
jgi:toxin ParE1/3/4